MEFSETALIALITFFLGLMTTNYAAKLGRRNEARDKQLNKIEDWTDDIGESMAAVVMQIAFLESTKSHEGLFQETAREIKIEIDNLGKLAAKCTKVLAVAGDETIRKFINRELIPDDRIRGIYL